MSNVWKIDSRPSEFGTSNSSLISLFRKNDLVFVGEEGAQRRFFDGVKKGDYFAIADQCKIIAIAKATGPPQQISDLKPTPVNQERGRFDCLPCNDWVGVRVKIVNLSPDDLFFYEKRGAFCSADTIAPKVIELFKKNSNGFSIKSYTYTISDTSQKEYRPLLDCKTRYIIPIFQRPYSWGKEQIIPFIDDIFSSYCGVNHQLVLEPMFIGTIQLSQKKMIDENEFDQEIIDGQQRITTLTVFLKILSEKYPLCGKLSALKFDWLETKVNNGEQNRYLIEFLNGNANHDLNLNPYLINANLIRDCLCKYIDNPCFTVDAFVDYLFSKLYFVAIETYAGLTKTLQIFNAINTTGLDLNVGDLFKIKMYEYLTDIQNENETVFEKISDLYQLIDRKNKEQGEHVVSIQGVLEIYKDYLIAKYDLPNVLFQFGTDTFFERLFDSILSVRQWEHFNNRNNLQLCLKELEDIVRMRFEWENSNYVSVENMFALNLIWWSRYGRYWRLVYLFLLRYQNEDDRYTKLSSMLIIMNKIFFSYSIIYAKSINEIHTFAYHLTKMILNDPYDLVMGMLHHKLLSIDREWVRSTLSHSITDNAKKKNLICLLSGFLTEREENSAIDAVKTILFDSDFDIEHIHATWDNSIEVDKTLQNTIGNLIMLESSINRGLGKKPFNEKIVKYQKSQFVAVRDLVQYSCWDTDAILKRRDDEVEKIVEYLFR